MEARGQGKSRGAEASFQYRINISTGTDLTQAASSTHIHSFIHSFHKSVGTCYVPNTVVGTGDKQWIKETKISVLTELIF